MVLKGSVSWTWWRNMDDIGQRAVIIYLLAATQTYTSSPLTPNTLISPLKRSQTWKKGFCWNRSWLCRWHHLCRGGFLEREEIGLLWNFDKKNPLSNRYQKRVRLEGDLRWRINNGNTPESSLWMTGSELIDLNRAPVSDKCDLSDSFIFAVPTVWSSWKTTKKMVFCGHI